MSKRGEDRDPHTYEQFMRQDAAEEELFHIQSAAQDADYTIGNDGTLNDLYREIDRLVTEKSLIAT
jgi:dephospho-CoA kinase